MARASQYSELQSAFLKIDQAILIQYGRTDGETDENHAIQMRHAIIKFNLKWKTQLTEQLQYFSTLYSRIP